MQLCTLGGHGAEAELKLLLQNLGLLWLLWDCFSVGKKKQNSCMAWLKICTVLKYSGVSYQSKFQLKGGSLAQHLSGNTVNLTQQTLRCFFIFLFSKLNESSQKIVSNVSIPVALVGALKEFKVAAWVEIKPHKLKYISHVCRAPPPPLCWCVLHSSTLGFILVPNIAASASICETWSIMTLLTLATLGRLAKLPGY